MTLSTTLSEALAALSASSHDDLSGSGFWWLKEERWVCFEGKKDLKVVVMIQVAWKQAPLFIACATSAHVALFTRRHETGKINNFT